MSVETLIDHRRQISPINSDINPNLAEWLKPNEGENQLKGLYLINTRLWLNQLKHRYGQDLSISTIPNIEWNKFIDDFDYIWLMGIYPPSPASRDHALKYCHQYLDALPDLNSETDVTASPFAIPDYSPNPQIAKDWTEWDITLKYLHQKNKKIILDFVPNHTGLDHPWAREHSDYYIQGSESQYWSNPDFYQKIIDINGQTRYLAHGKPPRDNFWADTLQLNFANPQVQTEMEKILLNLTKHCDGVRCDMAMLINPNTFLETWDWALSPEEINYLKNNSFWQKAIPKVKESARINGQDNFDLMAEAYWGLEELEKNGFNYIYLHDFYEHLKRVIRREDNESGLNLKLHLNHLINKQKLGCHELTYIENHDEDPAIRTMGHKLSKPAALLTAVIPNSIFMVNQGQETGHQIKIPMQISRFPNESIDPDISRFYDDLFSLRKSALFQTGNWKIIDVSSDPNLISLEVSQNDQPLRAIICVNVSDYTSFAQINKNETNHQIYNLSTGQICQAENLTENTIVTKLDTGDIKIIFLS